VQGLIRRKLEGEPRYLYPKAEEFAGGHRPLFIPGSVRPESFVVEGPLDALAVAAVGESAIAVGGADISEYQRQELQKLPGPLHILSDADDAGIEAGRRWTRDLYPKTLLCPPEYGDGLKDPADLYEVRGEGAQDAIADLKAHAADALELELSEAPKGSNSLGAYRVAKERILPLLSKLEDEGERDAALHDVADRLRLSIKPLRKALAALRAQATEVEQDVPEREEAAPKPGTQRHNRAMELLKDSRLLSRAAVDMKRLGHVGEFAAKKLALICAASARSGKPIQPSTHAQSGGQELPLGHCA
jgi:DNA primase